MRKTLIYSHGAIFDNKLNPPVVRGLAHPGFVAPTHSVIDETQQLHLSGGEIAERHIEGRGANFSGESVAVIGEVVALYVAAHGVVPTEGELFGGEQGTARELAPGPFASI